MLLMLAVALHSQHKLKTVSVLSILLEHSWDDTHRTLSSQAITCHLPSHQFDVVHGILLCQSAACTVWYVDSCVTGRLLLGHETHTAVSCIVQSHVMCACVHYLGQCHEPVMKQSRRLRQIFAWLAGIAA